MGMDLECIIENKYEGVDIINMNSLVDSWSDIRDYVNNFRTKGYQNYRQGEFHSIWESGDLDIESLHKIWEYQESRGQKLINAFIGVNRLSNLYCDITFNRNTITICPSPEHKYANLHEPEKAKYIIGLMRRIAKKFGQEEIIYCVDSAYPPVLLYSEAIAGLTFNNLKKVGFKEFGRPPENINEGMKNLFFIDKSSNEIPKFEKWNWLDFKYAEKLN